MNNDKIRILMAILTVTLARALVHSEDGQTQQ